LEFFVDFLKNTKGKYPTIPVPFIPILLIKRVILKEEEKSFWDAMKSRKKENRRQVLVRSDTNLIGLVKAMKLNDVIESWLYLDIGYNGPSSKVQCFVHLQYNDSSSKAPCSQT
jgi:hypothetical protein